MMLLVYSQVCFLLRAQERLLVKVQDLVLKCELCLEPLSFQDARELHLSHKHHQVRSRFVSSRNM